MAKQTINIGTAPNDGTGTPLRTAFDYCNLNFTELYTAVGPSGNNIVVPGSATITGDLTVDTSTLKVDSTNNRVGIGTASPATILDIQSAGGVFARIQNTTSTADAYLLVKNATGEGFFGINALGPYIYTASALPIVFTTATFERYRIAGDGVATWSNVGGVGGTAMTLNSTGLGVGASPATRLHISNSGDVYARIATTSVSKAGVQLSANGVVRSHLLYDDGAGTTYLSSGTGFGGSGQALVLQSGTSLVFYTNNQLATANMTLDASGNLLVGTTSAANQERLNLTSDRNVYIGRFFNSASSGGNYGFLINYSAAAPNNASNEFLACSDNAASRLFLYSNGGIANYQANDSNLSDIRTKTDIKPLASYWNKIKALEMVTFKYKDQTHSDDNIGLIAQQVESVAPEFIDADGFGETPSDGVPLKTIYTTDLYHASIKALQEAMARIEALEAKLA
jgi:hypothetical protein